MKKLSKQALLNDSKSFKGTPQRYIDFTQYLSTIKTDKNQLSVSVFNNKPESTKNSAAFQSLDKISGKKSHSKTNLKGSPSHHAYKTKIKNTFNNYNTEEYIKHFKKLKLDSKTPRINEKLVNAKKST